MTTRNSPLLIAGGGIGGLTAAAALQRKEFAVRVLEAAPEYRPVGAGITIQMNAMQALRQIGLADAVRNAGNVLNRLAIRFANGKPAVRMDMAEPAKKYGVPFVAIHRAQLQQVLAEAVGPQNIAFGFRVQNCGDDENGVVAGSADGRQERGELLIGADGLHSQVRTHLWGNEPLRYSGYTSWRGIVQNNDRVPTDEGTESWGDTSVFGLVPLADGELYWFATHQTSPDGKDAADPRDTILSATGNWHDPIRSVVESTPPEAIIRTDIRDRPPRFPWGRDRMTLLGDAVHPMTPNLGQGGGQAIEDGVVLAEALATADSLPAGLRVYEAHRHPRTKHIVHASRLMSALAHGRTPLMRFGRRWVFPNLPGFLRKRSMRKVFDFDGAPT
jgi:2-polyprenyl-6-methoxyphenol hydroxylase-like FAD-dependent oxidoreductase